jgi:hypothetical protein
VRETKGGPILAEVAVGMDDDDIEVVLEATEEVALRIEDTRGSPVVGAHVELSLPPPGVTLDPELPPYGDVSFRVISDGMTDAEGRVVLASVDVARLHRLTVRAPDERREFLPFEIQGWTPRDEVLALERGFFVTGSVRDVDQRAIAGRNVLATCPALPEGGAAVRRRLDGGIRRVSRQARTNEAGAFRLGPLPRGSWMLSVYGAEDSATGVIVDRDVDSVVLTLPAGEAAPIVDLRIRVPDFAEEDRGTMVFLGSNHARLDDEGCVVFRGARVGKAYALWIAGLSGGRYVWEKEFHIDGENMTLQPRRGGKIRGSVRVPEGAQLDSLALWPMGIIRVWIEEDPQAGSFDWSTDYVAGTFEVVGVPPGTWTVLVWGDCGEVTYEGEIEAGPGDEVVVELTSK